jgi:hypothetical protein
VTVEGASRSSRGRARQERCCGFVRPTLALRPSPAHPRSVLGPTANAIAHQPSLVHTANTRSASAGYALMSHNPARRGTSATASRRTRKICAEHHSRDDRGDRHDHCEHDRGSLGDRLANCRVLATTLRRTTITATLAPKRLRSRRAIRASKSRSKMRRRSRSSADCRSSRRAARAQPSGEQSLELTQAVEGARTHQPRAPASRVSREALPERTNRLWAVARIGRRRSVA